MKVIGFNCSPRKDGNTARMIRTLFEELGDDIETEFIQVGGTDIRGCRACGACRKNQDMRCIIEDDGVNGYLEKMISADAVIIGSPTYFADLTPEAKALIDRCGYVARSNNNPLRRKIGAAVIAVRRAGGIHAFDSINHFFTINEMIVPGSSYWNLSISRDIGDFDKDEEGIRTIRDLGKNIAWLMNKLK